MENKLVKKTDLKGLLESENVKSRINEILGKNAGTFTTSVIQIASQNTMLANAEPSSIVGAAMTAATLNLPLNNSLGLSYIIPFNEKQKDGSKLIKAQFQIGWKGFVRLAQRSGQFLRINSGDVKDGEILSKDRLSGDISFEWIQDEKERNSRKTIGYFAYFKLLNGYEHTLYMTIDELNKHGKKFSQTFKGGYGLWSTDFDSMAKKTVLKLLLSKFAPLSIEMAQAVEKDQATFNNAEDTEDITYSDNEEVEIDPNAERIMTLINGIENQEDIDFAREHVTEEYLPAFKKKIKEINEKNPQK